MCLAEYIETLYEHAIDCFPDMSFFMWITEEITYIKIWLHGIGKDMKI